MGDLSVLIEAVQSGDLPRAQALLDINPDLAGRYDKSGARTTEVPARKPPCQTTTPAIVPCPAAT